MELFQKREFVSSQFSNLRAISSSASASKGYGKTSKDVDVSASFTISDGSDSSVSEYFCTYGDPYSDENTERRTQIVAEIDQYLSQLQAIRSVFAEGFDAAVAAVRAEPDEECDSLAPSFESVTAAAIPAASPANN